MAWQAVWTNNLNALTTAQKQENVKIINSYFRGLGWKTLPIAAMLGNMELEGQMNPAQWQSGLAIYSGGFGLCQWTPYTKLSDFLGQGWEQNYNGQLERIKWESQPENQGVQWLTFGGVTIDGEYFNFENYTFQQFAHDTTHDLRWLTACWEQCYERGTPMINSRYNYALQWLDFISHLSTGNMPIWMMCKPYWKR